MSSSYLKAVNTTSSDIKLKSLFFAVFSLLILFAVFFQFPALPLVFVAALFFLFWVFSSINKFYLALLSYIYLLPNYSAYERYDFFPYYVRTDLIIASILVLLTYWVIGNLIDKWPEHKWHCFDWLLGLSILWSFLMFLWGNANGHDLKNSLGDFLLLLLYISYFPIRFSSFENKSLQQIWFVLSWIAVIVSVQYIFLSFSEAGLSDLIIRRVSTQQPHVAQLALPYFFGFFFFPYPRRKKILAIPAVLIILIMIFLSQQRALWVASILSVFLFWALFRFRDGINFKKLFRLALLLTISGGILFLILLIIDKLFSASAMATFFWRLSTFQDLARDESFLIRLGEINRAISQWQQNILLGTGLGATIEPINLNHFSPYLIDNSYVYILWKTGLVGLILFLFIVITPLFHGFIAFRRASHFTQMHLIGSLLAGWFGLLVIGLTNTSLVRYFYILLWTLVLATIELAYEKIRNE